LEWRKNKKGGMVNHAAFVIDPLSNHLRHSVHAHLLAGLVVPLKLYHPVDLCKKRIITPFAHVHARVEPGPALTHNNGPCMHCFAIVPLYAEELRIAVSSIS
jgi:hypothetical protein